MTAQTIKEAEHQLREFRQDEWSDIALAALAMALALAASFLHPPLALPLFIGALASCMLAGRAFFRRLELSDRLLLNCDAYVITEIRRRGEDMASMENRAGPRADGAGSAHARDGLLQAAARRGGGRRARVARVGDRRRAPVARSHLRRSMPPPPERLRRQPAPQQPAAGAGRARLDLPDRAGFNPPDPDRQS